MSVVCFSIALNGYDRMWGACLDTQRDYCRENGFRHWLITDLPWKLTPRQAAWLKVEIMRGLLAKGASHVFFIDADCEIRPHTPSFLGEFGEAEGVLVSPGKSGRINSGIVMLRDLPLTRAFLARILENCDNPVPKADATAYENGHFIHYGREFGIEPRLAHEMWNNNTALNGESYIQHYSGGTLRRWYMQQHPDLFAGADAGGKILDNPADDGKIDVREQSVSEFLNAARSYLAPHYGRVLAGRPTSTSATQRTAAARPAAVMPPPAPPPAAARAAAPAPSQAQATAPSPASVPTPPPAPAPAQTPAPAPAPVRTAAPASAPAKAPAATKRPMPIFDGQTLSVYHWTPPSKDYLNFGDELAPMVVRALLQRLGHGHVQVVEAQDKRAKLFSIGSVLQNARDGDMVWGAGVNGKSWPRHLETQRDVHFAAVRGPLTRDAVARYGIKVPKVFGDPGFLFAELFAAEIAAVTEMPPGFQPGGVIYIPNLNDDRFLDRDLIGLQDDVLMISPRESPFVVAAAIRQSRLVLSSSLHGIVLAESMGVPVRPVLSMFEPLFKYFDYFLGTGRTKARFASTIAQALKGPDMPPARFNRDALVEAFPLKPLGLLR
ncbi:polysaccharide pyruvyl transferase family protein [Pseudoroseomonas cervicalis]|uniref:polysaccharide pyruvyl transferase family protein n=1 Tax=Teichococcus cervicalis TaxID=204525 RepID=UPI0022F19E5F|nr:polysaccharide pyruvyl transferase family protein [Pseudoroseomonas cervicalis]WBV44537.1 polysaccharide pyruvyl transferase family protein [Pseudoroseomonas cervicalis]